MDTFMKHAEKRGLEKRWPSTRGLSITVAVFMGWWSSLATQRSYRTSSSSANPFTILRDVSCCLFLLEGKVSEASREGYTDVNMVGSNLTERRFQQFSTLKAQIIFWVRSGYTRT